MPGLWSAPPVRAARVSIARESMWRLSTPEHPAQRDQLLDRRGRLELSTYVVYTVTRDTREFEALVVPVLRTMAASSARCTLALTESATTFDAGRVRSALQGARDVGLTALVEISGGWSTPLLELLASAAPTYIRLAPELIRGAATVPELFRSLVTLGEFARARSIPLVARNPLDDAELDAVRVAGIGLLQWVALPFEPDDPQGRRLPVFVREG